MAEEKGAELPVPPRPALVLALVAAALWAATLGHGFTNWDDPEYVVAPESVARGWAGLADLWRRPFDGSWYPLSHTLTWVLHQAAGPSPVVFHAVQVALFAGAAALAPSALTALGFSPAAGFWAALLWVASPLRAESVAWAANLRDPLALLLLLAAFHLRRTGRPVAGTAAAVGALLARATLFPVLFLAPLLAWRDGMPWRRALVRTLPWTLPALAVGAAAAFAHLGTPVPERVFVGGTLAGSVPSALWLPWWYAGRIVAPLEPRALYPFTPAGWTDPRFFAALALWAACVALVVRARSPRRRLVVLAAWALPFAPVTGLVPLAFPLADRFTLVPSLVACGLLVAGASRLVRQPRTVAVVATGLAALLAVGAVARQRAWRDGVSLWEAERALGSGSWAVHLNLAGAYGGAGRWDDALRALEQVRRLAPGLVRVRGDVFYARAAKDGMAPERIVRHAEALREGGYGRDAVLRVAGAALKEGHAGPARALLEAMEPADVEVLALRTLACRLDGRPADAVRHARAVLRVLPGRDDVRVDLALALVDLGDFAEALRVTEAPAQDPRLRGLLAGARGFAMLKSGRLQEASELLLEAQRAAAASAPR